MSVQAKLEVVRRKHIVHLTGFGAYSSTCYHYLASLVDRSALNTYWIIVLTASLGTNFVLNKLEDLGQYGPHDATDRWQPFCKSRLTNTEFMLLYRVNDVPGVDPTAFCMFGESTLTVFALTSPYSTNYTHDELIDIIWNNYVDCIKIS